MAESLAVQLAAAIRKHCADTGETENQLAIRIGMPHQNLYTFLRQSEDPEFDPGRKKLERLADAVHLEWRLVPKGEAAT